MLDIISDLELSPKCHDVLLGFFDWFDALLFIFSRPYVYVDAQSTPSWQTTTVFHNHFYDKKTFNKQKFNKDTDLACQIWSHWCWYWKFIILTVTVFNFVSNFTAVQLIWTLSFVWKDTKYSRIFVQKVIGLNIWKRQWHCERCIEAVKITGIQYTWTDYYFDHFKALVMVWISQSSWNILAPNYNV